MPNTLLNAIAVCSDPPPLSTLVSPSSQSEIRYVVRDAAEALLPRPPRLWLLEELILERSLNLWVGRFGSKKTWSMLWAAVCVSLGKPFLGFDAPRPVKVLYIDQDMGEDYTTEYLERCIHGALAENEIAGRMSFISGAGFDLFNPDDVNLLYTEIARSGAELVFMDALRNFCPGRDENSVKDMQLAVNMLRQLVNASRAAVTVLHHENRGGEWSGSTAIPGGVDSMLSIKSEEGSSFINFKTDKKRAGKPQQFSAEAVWSDDGRQFYLSMADFDTGEKLNQKALDVLDYFENNGDTAMPDLLAYFDRISRASMYRLLDGLEKSGKVERKNKGAKLGEPAVYGLAPNQFLFSND